MNMPDYFSESLKQFLGLKILKSFDADADPGSGINSFSTNLTRFFRTLESAISVTLSSGVTYLYIWSSTQKVSPYSVTFWHTGCGFLIWQVYEFGTQTRMSRKVF
jgi:hypothetical protein